MSESSIVLNDLVRATKSALVSCVAELLEVQAGEIDPQAEFSALGFDSARSNVTAKSSAARSSLWSDNLSGRSRFCEPVFAARTSCARSK